MVFGRVDNHAPAPSQYVGFQVTIPEFAGTAAPIRIGPIPAVETTSFVETGFDGDALGLRAGDGDPLGDAVSDGSALALAVPLVLGALECDSGTHELSRNASATTATSEVFRTTRVYSTTPPAPERAHSGTLSAEGGAVCPVGGWRISTGSRQSV